MEAARFDLGEVAEQRSEQLIRSAHEAPRRCEQLAVGELDWQRD
jgi:hypothetical protein